MSIQNNNPLRAQNFLLTIPDLDHVTFSCRTSPIPTISINPITLATGSDVAAKIPGSVMTFDPMVITFAVDEDLDNYMQALDWILKLHNEDFDYTTHTKDASLIFTNNNNQANKEITFEGCWPSSMTEITLATNDETPELIATLIVQFDTFKFEK